jgi:hypothetical protein
MRGPTTVVKAKVFKPVKCGDGPKCYRFSITGTQWTTKPYLEHTCYTEEGVYSLANCRTEGEMLRACQEPQFVDYLNVPENGEGGGAWMQIKSAAFDPPWNTTWGRCDKRTCDPRIDNCPEGMANPVHNFNCHDKSVSRPGTTFVRTCMPDGTKCDETSYRTDQ